MISNETSPLIGLDGYAVGSIAVCGPANRFDAGAVEQLMPLVTEAARTISVQLGWNGVFPKRPT
jgi:IclR family transcriptional regulator, acetate operon repressor